MASQLAATRKEEEERIKKLRKNLNERRKVSSFYNFTELHNLFQSTSDAQYSCKTLRQISSGLRLLQHHTIRYISHSII